MSNSEQGRFAADIESMPEESRTEAEHDLRLDGVSRSMRSKLGPWLDAMTTSSSPQVDPDHFETEADRLTALLQKSLRRVRLGGDRYEHRLGRISAIDCVALVQANNLAHALSDSRRLVVGLLEGRQPQMVTFDDGNGVAFERTIDSVLIDDRHHLSDEIVSFTGKTPAKLTDAYAKAARQTSSDRSEYYGNRSRNFGRWPWSSLRRSSVALPRSADRQPLHRMDYNIVGKNPYDITFHPSTESSLKEMIGTLSPAMRSQNLPPAMRVIAPVQSA